MIKQNLQSRIEKKRVLGWLICLLLSSSAWAATTEEAMKNLAENLLTFDISTEGSSYHRQIRPRHDTDAGNPEDKNPLAVWEDVDGLDVMLKLSGKCFSQSVFRSVTGGNHLSTAEKDSIVNRFGTSEDFIYVFPDTSSPRMGDFIEMGNGIHATASPCYSCPNIGYHDTTATCYYRATGVVGPGETAVRALVDHPGEEAFGVHLPEGVVWQWTTVSQWRSMAQGAFHAEYGHHCHSCCHYTWHDGYTDSRGNWHSGYYSHDYCQSNRKDPCWNGSFSPTSILQNGMARKPWEIRYTGNYSNWILQTLNIHWKDREPPQISIYDPSDPYQEPPRQTGGETLPDAQAYVGGGLEFNTTGDFRRLGVRLWDNNNWANTVNCLIALQPSSWETDALNSGDGKFHFVRYVTGKYVVNNGKNNPPKAILMPSHVAGVVKYAAYVWDSSGNLNPSKGTILMNQPRSCYGVSSFNGRTGGDLLTDPENAVEYPFKAQLTGSSDLPDPFKPLESPFLPLNTGDALVQDNDRPNLMISLVNTRDRAQSAGKTDKRYALVFPPPPTTVASWVWKTDEFLKFTEGALVTRNEFLATESIFFMPIAADYTNDSVKIVSGSMDQDLKQKLLISPAQKNSSFRASCCLEDYRESDTDTEGRMVTSIDDMASTGARLGTGKSLNLLVAYPTHEDVEYEIWIWAQDNCRLVNNPSGKVDNIAAPPDSRPGSGIKSVKIVAKNEEQNKEYERTLSGNDVWNTTVFGPYKIVFRNPGDIWDGSSLPNVLVLEKKNPSLTVTATDLSGNERSYNLFFQVQDQKASIRVLEERNVR